MQTVQRLFAILMLAGALFSGCVIEHYDHYDHQYGTATLTWSIAGRSDAAACVEQRATLVRIVMRFDLDGVISDDLVACNALTTRYILRRGWHTATLTLLDGSHAPVSSPRDTGTFYVTQGRDTFVTVDFAASVVPLALDAGAETVVP